MHYERIRGDAWRHQATMNGREKQYVRSQAGTGELTFVPEVMEKILG